MNINHLKWEVSGVLLLKCLLLKKKTFSLKTLDLLSGNFKNISYSYNPISFFSIAIKYRIWEWKKLMWFTKNILFLFFMIFSNKKSHSTAHAQLKPFQGLVHTKWIFICIHFNWSTVKLLYSGFAHRLKTVHYSVGSAILRQFLLNE